ncbi:hypothetical protein C2E20_8756 [Micractinium conductrix]|uniref:Glycosyltransferase family 92 protein n=1 Tax=Micractinium conductrix TaxID=554055 RepID=A0A2P6V0E9_9CHLO|nr:hypothetical protein C2E20_8756 [Micractinium conductrix]|eukprot:PSC67578.1 hypothetical protein C2E20_8756 [Micractinium conductrix]
MSVRPARARRCKTWAATLACCILAGAVGLMCRRAAVHPLLASLPGGAAPAAAECELEGTAYDCSSLFDWRWYVEHHADLAGLTAAQALEHWAVHGAAEGRRSHRGPAVLKLVVMTKNEVMLRSWVLYHAHVFGAENLYIIDGSTDADAVAFLAQAECQLGVHVFRSAANLNELEALMTALLRSLTLAADYLIKVDTDEFLAVAPPVDASGVRSGPLRVGAAVREHLDSLQAGGAAMLRTRLRQEGSPPQQCPADPALSTDFAPLTADSRPKILFVAHHFASVGLGGHAGRSRGGSDSIPAIVDTDLALLEFRYDCYDRWTANNRKAVFSHGYVLEGDSDAVMQEKLTPKQSNDTISHHKVQGYLAHLVDPAASWRAYYARFDGVQQVRFHDLAMQLQFLHRAFDAQAAAMRCRRPP